MSTEMLVTFSGHLNGGLCNPVPLATAAPPGAVDVTRRASPTLAAGLWGTLTGARAPRSGAVEFPKPLGPAAAHPGYGRPGLALAPRMSITRGVLASPLSLPPSPQRPLASARSSCLPGVPGNGTSACASAAPVGDVGRQMVERN